MRAQSQIQRTLGSAAAIDAVVRILSQEEFPSRRALGRRICAEFDFHDHRGRPQLAGCLKALRRLERDREQIVLPPGGPAPACTGQSGALAADAALAATVPEEQLAQVEGLALAPMAEQAEDVKHKDVIIIPSPRFPLRSLEEAAAAGPEGAACAKFEQARPSQHATQQAVA